MIKVNGKEFDANVVLAEDGSMSITFATKEKLSKIEEYFPESVTIEIIENGEETAKYYNKAVLSLKVINGTERSVNVILRVTALQESAEEEINGRIDTSDGAVEELAVMAADHEARLAALEEQIAALIPASESKTSEEAENVTTDSEIVTETAENSTTDSENVTSETEV